MESLKRVDARPCRGEQNKILNDKSQSGVHFVTQHRFDVNTSHLHSCSAHKVRLHAMKDRQTSLAIYQRNSRFVPLAVWARGKRLGSGMFSVLRMPTSFAAFVSPSKTRG